MNAGYVREKGYISHFLVEEGLVFIFMRRFYTAESVTEGHLDKPGG